MNFCFSPGRILIKNIAWFELGLNIKAMALSCTIVVYIVLCYCFSTARYNHRREHSETRTLPCVRF